MGIQFVDANAGKRDDVRFITSDGKPVGKSSSPHRPRCVVLLQNGDQNGKGNSKGDSKSSKSASRTQESRKLKKSPQDVAPTYPPPPKTLAEFKAYLNHPEVRKLLDEQAANLQSWQVEKENGKIVVKVLVSSINIPFDVLRGLKGVPLYELRGLAELLEVLDPRNESLRLVVVTSTKMTNVDMEALFAGFTSEQVQLIKERVTFIHSDLQRSRDLGENHYLADRLLEEPKTISKLREAVQTFLGDVPATAENTVLSGFFFNEAMEQLSKRLNATIAGTHPVLNFLGTKQFGPILAQMGGVPAPRGEGFLYSIRSLTEAIVRLLHRKEDGDGIVFLKNNESASGMGIYNFLIEKLEKWWRQKGVSVRNEGRQVREAIAFLNSQIKDGKDLRIILDKVAGMGEEETIAHLRNQATDSENLRIILAKAAGMSKVKAMAFLTKQAEESKNLQIILDRITDMGGVVEMGVSHDDAPSGQGIIGFDGEVTFVSSHNQIMDGNVYLGAVQPARDRRGPQELQLEELIRNYTLAIGKVLADMGVRGRFGVDFFAKLRPDGTWEVTFGELNLRKGGTTHPYDIVVSLTGARYSEKEGMLVKEDGEEVYYKVTDNFPMPGAKGVDLDWFWQRFVNSPEYRNTLYPTDKKGVRLHTLPWISQYEKAGVVVYGGSWTEVEQLYKTVEKVFARIVDEYQEAKKERAEATLVH